MRVLVVLHSGIDQGVLLGQLPGIVALLAGMVFTRLRVPALRRYVATSLRRRRHARPGRLSGPGQRKPCTTAIP